MNTVFDRMRNRILDDLDLHQCIAFRLLALILSGFCKPRVLRRFEFRVMSSSRPCTFALQCRTAIHRRAEHVPSIMRRLRRISSLLGNARYAPVTWIHWTRDSRCVLLASCFIVLGATLLGCATSNSGGSASSSSAKQPQIRTLQAQDWLRTQPPPSNEPLLGHVRLQALQRAERRYRAIASAGGWPALTKVAHLQAGFGNSQWGVLSQRLALTGDLLKGYVRDSDQPNSSRIAIALGRFQQRHGLLPTGNLDPETIKALNVPVEHRLAQIRTNIARVRDNARLIRAGQPYIVVNIPAFTLEAIDRRRVVQRHRVIVGKPDRQTPEVRAQIQAINFYPYWHVPKSIVRKDLIPGVLKDRNFLRKHRIRVRKEWQGEEISFHKIDWRSPTTAQLKFRQDPGPRNALGVVRLDMPNKHGVYMHDTPKKALFRRQRRAFSAGCVRVEGVLDLVAWALRSMPEWDEARVRNVLTNGDQVDVPLPTPIPVSFVYVTAWASPDDRVSFRTDLYGLDSQVGFQASLRQSRWNARVQISP